MAEKQEEMGCIWKPANDSRFDRRELEIQKIKLVPEQEGPEYKENKKRKKTGRKRRKVLGINAT